MIRDKNKEALVSVIIPTYNRGYILSRSITSVLNQTYQNLELIIVDDGSTDNTQKIVKGFSDPRIRYIVHDENKGLSTSRNTGFKNSRGDFIAFLDSDDEYLQEKIEKSIKAFRKLPIRFGLVASNYFKIFNNGKKIVGLNVKKIKRMFPHVSSWVLRRDIFSVIGLFNEKILLSEDVDYFHYFCKKYAFYTIEEPLLIVHQSSDGFFSDMEKVFALRKQYLVDLTKDRSLYARHLKYLGKDYLSCNKIDEAKDCFLKAFLSYPLPGYFLNYLRCHKRKN